jgi:hypothetical protein
VHGVRCIEPHVPRRLVPTLRRRLLPASGPAGQQAAGATLAMLARKQASPAAPMLVNPSLGSCRSAIVARASTRLATISRFTAKCEPARRHTCRMSSLPLCSETFRHNHPTIGC